MLATLSGMVTLARFEQKEKAVVPMEVTSSNLTTKPAAGNLVPQLSVAVFVTLSVFIVMFLRLLQRSKAGLSIKETPLPMVMLARLPHWKKAFFPILVTLSGMVMLVRLVQVGYGYTGKTAIVKSVIPNASNAVWYS